MKEPARCGALPAATLKTSIEAWPSAAYIVLPASASEVTPAPLMANVVDVFAGALGSSRSNCTMPFAVAA